MSHLVLSGNILCRQYTHYTRKRLCFLCADRLHNGSGIPGTHGASIDQTRKIHLIQIIHIFSCAQYLSFHIYTMNPAAYLNHLLLLIRSHILPQHPGCQPNGINDLFIAGAPAVVIADSVCNFRTAGIGIRIQKSLGTDHHTRNTEAALHRSRLAKRIYIHVLFPLA